MIIVFLKQWNDRRSKSESDLQMVKTVRLMFKTYVELTYTEIAFLFFFPLQTVSIGKTKFKFVAVNYQTCCEKFVKANTKTRHPQIRVSKQSLF